MGAIHGKGHFCDEKRGNFLNIQLFYQYFQIFPTHNLWEHTEGVLQSRAEQSKKEADGGKWVRTVSCTGDLESFVPGRRLF